MIHHNSGDTGQRTAGAYCHPYFISDASEQVQKISVQRFTVYASAADDGRFHPQLAQADKRGPFKGRLGMGIHQHGYVTPLISFAFTGGKEAVVIRIAGMRHHHADQAGVVLRQRAGHRVGMEIVFLNQAQHAFPFFVLYRRGSVENTGYRCRGDLRLFCQIIDGNTLPSPAFGA